MDSSLPRATVCPACGSADGFREFRAREMQFGTREEFRYRECARCGSVFIASIPADLSRHYPTNYYSFAAAPAAAPAMPAARRRLTRWLIGSPDPLARFVAQRLSYRRQAFYQWARLGGAGLDTPILDLGCGSGQLLRRMQRAGFSRLTGVDPYTPQEIDEPGFRVVKAERPPAGARFGLVMMHHVLEHLSDPVQGLISARESMEPGGKILVRVPVAGSFVHRKYGADWYNLDAPRHLVVPSRRGIDALARQAGLRLLRAGFDGGEPSFLMSESYARNIPSLQAPRPNRATRVRYRRWARRLNAQGEGDMGVFVFAAD
jgi:SAM-dependent methyltransferase